MVFWRWRWVEKMLNWSKVVVLFTKNQNETDERNKSHGKINKEELTQPHSQLLQTACPLHGLIYTSWLHPNWTEPSHTREGNSHLNLILTGTWWTFKHYVKVTINQPTVSVDRKKKRLLDPPLSPQHRLSTMTPVKQVKSQSEVKSHCTDRLINLVKENSFYFIYLID